jgi:hypothetical protein
MTDLEKLSIIWEDIRLRGRADISIEGAVWLMRTAAYAIATRHEPPAPDERQLSLELVGGRWKPRPVTIRVS